MVAIFSDKREFIFKAVADMYTDVATHPEKTFHFPTGRLACLFVGYPGHQLDLVPATAPESFAGVGYPFAANAIRAGDVVLDLGSGSGTDTLIAAALTGPGGRVYGLDMTQAMLDKLRRNVAAMGARNVEPLAGNAEEIPLPDASIDVVTSNGVLNLVPDKPRAFAELAASIRTRGALRTRSVRTPSCCAGSGCRQAHPGGRGRPAAGPADQDPATCHRPPDSPARPSSRSLTRCASSERDATGCMRAGTSS